MLSRIIRNVLIVFNYKKPIYDKLFLLANYPLKTRHLEGYVLTEYIIRGFLLIKQYRDFCSNLK